MKPPSQGIHQRTTEKERQAALTAAVDRYGDDILRFLFSFTKNWEDANDLAQDLWVYVFRHFPIEKYQEIELLLWKAKNLAITWYSNKKKRSEVPADQQHLENTPAPYAQPRNLQEERAAYTRFWELFHGINLTEPQKQAFWYRERFGYTLKETGQKLGGTPTATVHDWVELVKQRCADYLNRRNQQ